MDKRDPYADLGETLGDLVARHDTATGATAAAEGGRGPRGPRQRPRFRSEDSRLRLTIDVDLEPSVVRVLQALAADPPEAYGEGELRSADLATAALMVGLFAFINGRQVVDAEWTAKSRGKRNLVIREEFEAEWDAICQALEIDRWTE